MCYWKFSHGDTDMYLERYIKDTYVQYVINDFLAFATN